MKVGHSKARKAAMKSRLLAASTLSERKIKQVIRCYAEAKTAKEAQAICGLSHVTVYKLYRQIRQRLLDARVYTTKEAFIDFWNEQEEEGPWYHWTDFFEFLAEQLRRRYGLKAESKPLYESEAIFRYDFTIAPAQFYRLILVTIKVSGPLNRPPVFNKSPAAIREFMRLVVQNLYSAMRRMNSPPEQIQMLEAVQESYDDDITAIQANISEKRPNPPARRRSRAARS